MASEYNLISAAQYDKLMKIQSKLDNDNINGKQHLQTNNTSDTYVTKEKVDNQLPEHEAYEETISKNKTLVKDNIKSTPNNNINNSQDTTLQKTQNSSNKDIGNEGAVFISNEVRRKRRASSEIEEGGVKNKFKRQRKNKEPIKLSKLSNEHVDAIVAQFNNTLKRKVKRLVVYIFKFGRDISLQNDILYYKKDKIGDVVKLIKSLFEVTPPVKGLRKLRRLLFILSVPSELFTLSTTERTQIAKGATVGNKNTIEWLDY
jgi:hypothetical protein